MGDQINSPDCSNDSIFFDVFPTKTLPKKNNEKIRDVPPTCWSRWEFLRQSFCTRNDPERSEELLVVLSCYKETLQELQHSISSLFENTGQQWFFWVPKTCATNSNHKFEAPLEKKGHHGTRLAATMELRSPYNWHEKTMVTGVAI